MATLVEAARCKFLVQRGFFLFRGFNIFGPDIPEVLVVVTRDCHGRTRYVQFVRVAKHQYPFCMIFTEKSIVFFS